MNEYIRAWSVIQERNEEKKKKERAAAAATKNYSASSAANAADAAAGVVAPAVHVSDPSQSSPQFFQDANGDMQQNEQVAENSNSLRDHSNNQDRSV